jgi:hypothetical protein
MLNLRKITMSKVQHKQPQMFTEIKSLIEQSRQQVATVVNSAMTSLYWQIGKRINGEILKEARAEYGKQIAFIESMIRPMELDNE